MALDGSVAAPSDNVLIYATSNRRHLMPEYMAENLETRHVGEKCIRVKPPRKKFRCPNVSACGCLFTPSIRMQYLAIVQHWLAHFGVADGDSEQVRREALQWALGRGSRSGRSAWQFARDWAGRMGLKTDDDQPEK